MEQIHAWMYNPDHALFKGASKKTALFTIHCIDPQKCDLHKNCNSCLNQEVFGGCKFGRKSKSEGPTKRAKSYGTWVGKAKEANKDYFGKLATNANPSGIFKIHDHWHLPYSYMVGDEKYGFPIESKWVHEDDMTADLLEKICSAKPRYLFEYRVIANYQDDSIPRFLHDLKTRYPDLFALAPQKHRDRIADISFVGRKADIKTCNPGTYVIKGNKWGWDGTKLIGSKMLFQPVEGSIRIEIEPDDGQAVAITDDSQVTPDTVFLD